MRKLQIPYRELANLALLRATVFLAEVALRNRHWLTRARNYAPMMAAALVAYVLGRVVGLALIS